MLSLQYALVFGHVVQIQQKYEIWILLLQENPSMKHHVLVQLLQEENDINFVRWGCPPEQSQHSEMPTEC